MEINEELLMWSDKLTSYHMPRWEELPEFSIYMDQVTTLVESYLYLFSDGDKIITAAMVNNYVKLNLIPKPVKKRYERIHIAYLIAITMLKQVIPIKEVRDGIEQQTSICGLRDAYNLFCDEQEKALKEVANVVKEQTDLKIVDIHEKNMAMKMATLAFATKILAQKIVSLNNEKNKEEEEDE